MSESKKSTEITKKQNQQHRNIEDHKSYKGVPHVQATRRHIGGSYTSGKKRMSAKTRTYKEKSRQESKVTGAKIRGRQVGRRK